MLKLFYVIFMNLHRAPYIIPLMRNRANHPERYTVEQRYALVLSYHLFDEQNRQDYDESFRFRKSPKRRRLFNVPESPGKV